MSFATLGLSSSFLNTLEQQKYVKPYPIQEKAIPAILNGKDVLGIAKTGSGKTASFVLPLLQNLQGNMNLPNRHISILVLVPTRELAMQVRGVFEDFAQAMPEKVKSMAIYGGVSINPQMKSMMGVNVLVATPGRLLELVENKAVHLSSIRSLVLDEADKMLNLGFEEEMNQIFKLLPSQKQNLLFSATLGEDINAMKQVLLREPEIIKIEPEKENIDLINQTAYFVESEKKGPLLRYLIKHNKMNQVLVFTESGYNADNVARKLFRNGINAKAIHGKKSQGSRKEALRQFKNGEIDVLVATDLLSRGIDISFLPYVINYDLPRSPKDYIHRIGRTGRAESPGEAISLVEPEAQHHFKVIQKKMGKWVTRVNIDNLDLSGF